MGPRSKRARTWAAATAACLFALGLAPAAVAAPPDNVPAPAAHGPKATAPTSHANGASEHKTPKPPASQAPGQGGRPVQATPEDVDLPEPGDVDYHAASPLGHLDRDDDDDSSEGNETEPSGVPDSEVDQDQDRDNFAVVVTAGPSTTTTTQPQTAAPVAPAEPSSGDAEQRAPAGDVVSNASLSDVAPASPAGAEPPQETTPAVPEAVQSVASSPTTAALVDWRAFVDARPGVTPAAVPTPEEHRSATSTVLSWLVESESLPSTMSAMSPIVVLATIWDAITSAGSGLAAPASGLGTFVVLVLLDRRRLAARSRVPGRRRFGSGLSPSALRAS